MFNKVVQHARMQGELIQILKRWQGAVEVKDWDLADQCHNEYYEVKDLYEKTGQGTPIPTVTDKDIDKVLKGG